MALFPSFFLVAAIPFDVGSYVAIMMIGNALIFAACGFPVDIVKERELKIKHQLSVMGLSSAGYWLSNLIKDLIMLSIPCTLVLILVWAFSVSLLNFLVVFFFFFFSFFLFFFVCFHSRDEHILFCGFADQVAHRASFSRGVDFDHSLHVYHDLFHLRHQLSV